jgi:hypothetical protein
MSHRSFLIAALFCLTSLGAKAQHPVVQSIVDGVRIDSLMKWVNELSGELPVDVGNGPELIISRHKFNEGNAKAQQYLAQKLEQFGDTPEVQTFSSTGNNLLAVKEGSVYPDQVLILCAHYDAMPAVRWRHLLRMTMAAVVPHCWRLRGSCATSILPTPWCSPCGTKRSKACLAPSSMPEAWRPTTASFAA